MVKHGRLDVPVVGVARAGWNLDQLRAWARDSVEQHGGLDPAALEKWCGLLHYVDGGFQDPATSDALHRELGSAQRPAHYLAIPLLFGVQDYIEESWRIVDPILKINPGPRIRRQHLGTG